MCHLQLSEIKIYFDILGYVLVFWVCVVLVCLHILGLVRHIYVLLNMLACDWEAFMSAFF